MSQLWKLPRAEQMEVLRKWSSEMRVPSPTQTKSPVLSPPPTRRVSARLAKLAAEDEIDENVAVIDENDTVINENDAVIDENDAEIEENDAVIVEIDAIDGVRQQEIKNDVSDLLELKTVLADRDTTIARLEKELAQVTRNWEGQIDQLMWLNSLVQEKEVKLFDTDLTVSALESTVSDQAIIINNLWCAYKEKQEQLVEKDKCLKGMEMKLDILKESDRVSKELSMAQKQLAKSSLALASKMKKSKFVTAHAVTYATTKPRLEIKQEMIDAEKREREKRRAKQKAEIDVLISAVDRIAAGYDRYENVSTIITFSEPRSEIIPDHLFTWIHTEMVGLWLYTVEPTVEEQEKYEKHLLKQMRPDPIYSPDLPKAKVNWQRLNTNMKRNLPMPDQYPVHGCAQDPEFYTAMKAVYWKNQKQEDQFLFDLEKPFGALFGFWTSQGVLAPPEEPVHGYVCSPESGTWVIAAEGG